MKTIVSMKFGSHLYGTNTLESDIDYKAVHIPDARDILLQRVQNSISNKRPKAEGEKNAPGDIDQESYSLQRYLQLLAEGQTVSLDMLFAPNSMLSNRTRLWDHIVNNRHRLLTKKSAAFIGYCRQQANKYGIKGSRVAAARAASEFFDKEYRDFTVAQVSARLCNVVNEHPQHCQFVTQVVNKAGDVGTFFECCGRKVDFKATIKQAREVFSRLYENYGARAHQAEQNEGVDWKALSHAVRVGREALELLAHGHITFPLENANHILDIKKGQLPYEAVAAEIEHLLDEVEKASLKSPLRDHADQEWIDNFVAEVYADQIKAPS